MILRGAVKLALLTLQTAARSRSQTTTQLLVADAIAGLRIGLEMAGEESAHG